jgi:hypothetical protein
MLKRISHIDLTLQSQMVVELKLCSNACLTSEPLTSIWEIKFPKGNTSTTDIQDGKKVLAPSGGFLQVSNSIRVYFNLDIFILTSWFV